MGISQMATKGRISMISNALMAHRICNKNREYYPAESAAHYWKPTVAIPFLDVICSELTSRFSKKRRAHYELCALINQVITSMSKETTVQLAQVLHEKCRSVCRHL